MFTEPEFWVAVSFVIFVGILGYAGGLRALRDGIDSRARRIQAELDEARRLREEAAQVLADYKRRREDAEREAEAIVAAAREAAQRTAAEAHQRMTDFVARRTAAAEAKIAQAETQAMSEVRAAAADAAVRVSESILRDRMKGDAGQELLVHSLDEVKTRLHA